MILTLLRYWVLKHETISFRATDACVDSVWGVTSLSLTSLVHALKHNHTYKRMQPGECRPASYHVECILSISTTVVLPGQETASFTQQWFHSYVVWRSGHMMIHVFTISTLSRKLPVTHKWLCMEPPAHAVGHWLLWYGCHIFLTFLTSIPPLHFPVATVHTLNTRTLLWLHP